MNGKQSHNLQSFLLLGTCHGLTAETRTELHGPLGYPVPNDETGKLSPADCKAQLLAVEESYEYGWLIDARLT